MDKSSSHSMSDYTQKTCKEELTETVYFDQNSQQFTFNIYNKHSGNSKKCTIFHSLMVWISMSISSWFTDLKIPETLTFTEKDNQRPLHFFCCCSGFGGLFGFFVGFFLVLPLLCLFVSGIFLLMSSLLFNAFSHFCYITLFVLRTLHNFRKAKLASGMFNPNK